LLGLTLNSCVKIPNLKVCSVAGTMSAGSICADTLRPNTYDMTLEETIEFLEAQPERPDPTNPNNKLPARGAAIFMSADDWNRMKTALDEACRELGSHCTPEIENAVRFQTSVLRKYHPGQ
jgi:hypothetical protein